MAGRELVGRGVAVGAIGVLSVIVGGVGVATAANGGSLVLGHSNKATKTTTLSDSKGTPLSLKAGHGKPPFRVNSSAKVRHLNADELDGSNAAGLATSGAGVSSQYPDGNRGIVKLTFIKVTQTRVLAKGTYYVSATVSATLPPADTLSCVLTAGAPTQSEADNSAFAQGPTANVPETGVITVTSGQQIAQYCELQLAAPPTPNDQAEVSQSGLTAVRIAHAGGGTALPSIPVG
jgi:hypothetical protein